jgi:hypothetical protein
MKRITLAVAGMLMLVGSSGSAHHGYSSFDREHPITIDGTLESFLYANPHVIMQIRASDDTVYTVTWQAAMWVEREAGVTKTTFKLGDRLVIRGAPSRDPASHEVTLLQQVRRPSDGWTWTNR